MSKAFYDLLRKLQWMVPAVTALYAVFDECMGIGFADTVCTISAAFVTFIGVVLQHESDSYFSEKDIVNKVDPVEETEAEG